MKKGTRLLLLLVLLVLVIGVYVFLTPEEPEIVEEPDTTIYAAIIPEDRVTELSWEVAARTVSFKNTEDGWVCTSDKRHKTDGDSPRFDGMLEVLSAVTATRYVEGVTDLGEYGLDLPQTIISVTQADGTVTQFAIGDQNLVTGEYYLQVSGDDGVYLVDSKLLDAFSVGLFDLLEIDDIPDLSDATTYQVDKTTYYRVEQDDIGESVWCTLKNGSYQPIDEEKSRALSNALIAIHWTDCIDYYADSDEVRSYEYNLEKGKLITVTYPDTDGESATYRLVVGNAYDEEHTIVSPTDSPLVNKDTMESNMVYSMENSIVNALLMK